MRDQGQVGEADLACGQGHAALTQAIQVPKLLANTDPIGGGAAGHVAVGLEPRDRAVTALLIGLLGAGKIARHVRELDLEQIDGVAEADQPLGENLPSYFTPTPHPHKESIRTYVWTVKRKKKLTNSRQ